MRISQYFRACRAGATPTLVDERVGDNDGREEGKLSWIDVQCRKLEMFRAAGMNGGQIRQRSTAQIEGEIDGFVFVVSMP